MQRPSTRVPRLKAAGLARVARVALVTQAVVVATGAAVRLTGSGLGCPDWPTCQDGRLVSAWRYHAVVEFGNRAIIGLVSLTVLAAVAGALLLPRRRRGLTLLSLGLAAGVVVQVVLGGLTVRHRLAPGYVMAHFLVSTAILADAFVLDHLAHHAAGPPRPVVGAQVRALVAAMVGLLALVIVAGTVTTAAGPHSGDGAVVARLPVPLRDVAELHSTLVMLLTGMALVTVMLLRVTAAPAGLQRRALVFMGLIAAQAAIGYTQYFLHLPAGLVEVHVAGSVALWLAGLALLAGCSRRPTLVGAPAPVRVTPGRAAPALAGAR